MNWKVASFIALIIIVLGVGAYVISKKQSATASAGTATTTETTGPTVQAQDVSVGTGAQATPGTIVSVLYVGKLPDGTVFDSSEAHGNEPLKFQLGTEGLIPGFQIGVNGMKEGGERLLAVPPELGYGNQDMKDEKGNVIIPANSTIVFDVKLVKVEPAPAGGAASTQTAPAAQ
jgi:FKBP-type peptidyl-prolyl cis-trans isomerase